jgi:ABC-type proline/glycine betaine transport system ATPase subunit
VGKTTVFITHDLARIGHRIGIMRDGRMVQIGTPSDIVNRPKDDYVRAFVQGISRLNILSAADITDPGDRSREEAAGGRCPRLGRGQQGQGRRRVAEGRAPDQLIS